MHAFVEGTIAAAQREIRKCREALSRGDYGRAYWHAINAEEQVKEAVRLDEQLAREVDERDEAIEELQAMAHRAHEAAERGL